MTAVDQQAEFHLPGGDFYSNAIDVSGNGAIFGKAASSLANKVNNIHEFVSLASERSYGQSVFMQQLKMAN